MARRRQWRWDNSVFAVASSGQSSCDTLLLLSRSYFDKDASHRSYFDKDASHKSLSLQFDYCCIIIFCCVLKSRTRDLCEARFRVTIRML